MRIAMGIYLLIHGLCHFVGFVVPWNILTMKGLPGAKIGILTNGLVLAYLAGASLRWLPEIK